MAKKSTSTKNKPINSLVKQGGAVLLVLLMLSACRLFSQRDETLPTTVTDPAGETAVSNLLPVSASTRPWAGADGDFDYYVLALSWQPAFCETNSRKPECASQTESRYDATNFVLHGLWPNRENDPNHTFAYCEQPQDMVQDDKEGAWCALPDLPLLPDVAEPLNTVMPGVASCLDHHEWYKHGVCAGMPVDAYFALSNELALLFAQTAFNQYVADRIGQEVSRSDLLAQFEAEFGPGADDYLSLRCTETGGRHLLNEIRLVLKQDLAEIEDFADLFPTQYVPPDGNCPPQFMIDAVGPG